ncbi:hypothetical protein [Polaromonas sp.]|uniref:hypothetical protein n=1 Tax=Polaromonas sp. TaxID=1869339 RepID=UPI0032660128
MNVTFWTPLLTALATVSAALLAAVFSFVTFTVNKEQKTSELRQAWIDGLREDVAKFCAAAQAMTRVIEAQNTPGGVAPFTVDKIGEIRLQAAESSYRIRLRLNLGERPHESLMELIDSALQGQNELISTSSRDCSPVRVILQKVSLHSSAILKDEWERVKAGEPPFKEALTRAKQAIDSLTIVVGILVFAVFVYGLISIATPMRDLSGTSFKSTK